jgi:asparagine synthase (glutamine-hydrolysing)
MCGIAGIISSNPAAVTKERLKKMADTLVHRGPDGEGFFIDTEVTGTFAGMAHRRLAIIDLSERGIQPLQYMSRYVIVHNGEIYNYTELRDELRNQGYRFATQTDTEVIAAAFDQYGKECIQHFDGMFAFALWDKKEKKLFCARDRFGEKPFFYFFDRSRYQFLFASEMKALWAAGAHKTVNSKLLFQYLTLGDTNEIHHPEHSFFKDILQLPPGQTLNYDPQEVRVETESYWDLDKESVAETPLAEAIDKFKSLFFTSVKRRLRSDVSIGTNLSGGLDSSSIVSACTTLSGTPFTHHSFSCIFPGFAKDESDFIRIVAEKFRLSAHMVNPSADELIRDMEEVCYHQEEPFNSASVYAQFRVFQLAKQNGIKVLLDGQGADEILAGYSRHIHWFLQERLGKYNHSQTRKELHALRNNQVDFTWGLRNYFAALFPALAAGHLERRAYNLQKSNDDIHPAFLSQNFEKGSVYKPTIDKLNDVLYFDTMIAGLKELLRYADRNAMAHSCEPRLPFLSHELVQYIFTLPSGLKIRDGFTKWILRKSMANYLPDEIAWRTNKVGFEPPQQRWLQHPLVASKIHHAREKLVEMRILNPSVLQKKIQPQTAYAAENYDWRYWLAAMII